MHGHVPRARAQAAESNVLLEITPVAKSDDVHEVVERIQSKAQQILVNELNLDPRYRAAAGIGTTVVQKNQEEYMEAAWQQVGKVLASYGKGPGHVFNLGHGIHPEVKPEHALAMIEAVHELSPQYHQ